MAHSVESRAPFLDFRLVEFLQSLPEDFLLFNGQTKRILRRSMRAVLPESIRTRKDKMGFVTPEELWVREHATDWFLDNIDATVSRSSGLIRPSIRKFARDVIAGNRPFDSTLWRIVSFGSWLNRFSVTV